MSSFNFEKFYDVGNHLRSYSNSEEYQRSSATRYYYSVFNSVKDYYETSFRKHLPSTDSHGTLIRELENSPFRKENELGEKLRILRNNRNHADYFKRKFRLNKVNSSKKKSEEVFSLLGQLSKNPLRLMKK